MATKELMQVRAVRLPSELFEVMDVLKTKYSVNVSDVLRRGIQNELKNRYPDVYNEICGR